MGSVTYSRLQSENVKWKFQEINVSRVCVAGGCRSEWPEEVLQAALHPARTRVILCPVHPCCLPGPPTGWSPLIRPSVVVLKRLSSSNLFYLTVA